MIGSIKEIKNDLGSICEKKKNPFMNRRNEKISDRMKGSQLLFDSSSIPMLIYLKMLNFILVK